LEIEKTFAIGHFGLGYLLATASSKITKSKINLPLVLTVSVLPDFDILFPDFISHRGLTHSLFFSFIILLPFFIIYRKRVIPYFVVLLSHSLIGDIYGPYYGVQLFWPFSSDWVTISEFSNRSLLSISLELSLFIFSFCVMFLNKDFQKYFFDSSKLIYWVAPLGSVVGPFFLIGTHIRFNIPFLLVFPSLFYIGLFSLPLFTFIYKSFNG
jgi:membrane-bound metal-dependent hydrolase YbcI (DUF457 family)